VEATGDDHRVYRGSRCRALVGIPEVLRARHRRVAKIRVCRTALEGAFRPETLAIQELTRLRQAYADERQLSGQLESRLYDLRNNLEWWTQQSALFGDLSIGRQGEHPLRGRRATAVAVGSHVHGWRGVDVDPGRRARQQPLVLRSARLPAHGRVLRRCQCAAQPEHRLGRGRSWTVFVLARRRSSARR
jgi:hypothetical protein